MPLGKFFRQYFFAIGWDELSWKGYIKTILTKPTLFLVNTLVDLKLLGKFYAQITITPEVIERTWHFRVRNH